MAKMGPDKNSKMGVMALNTTKAGMEGLDKVRINQIIEEASKGSKFYVKKQADQARIDRQVTEMKTALLRLSSDDLSRSVKETDSVILDVRSRRDLSRTIVHVDMDMFYAAVEMRDEPSLANVPMAVGGPGMLSTSNYKARKFGVRAAMPGFIGKKLCPGLVIVPPNMDKYAASAEVVRAVFREYDPNFCPMSLDEAFLDLTEQVDKLGLEDREEAASTLVNKMRLEIKEKTGGLTASAGIASNCLLAKVCSDLNKPDGQFQLPPNAENIIEFMADLNIRKIGGVGNVQEQLLNAIGVKTCADIYLRRGELKLLFSEISFYFFMKVSQGIGSTRIEPPEERDRKSISTETTFRDTWDRNKLLDICRELSTDLAGDMNKKGVFGQTVTIKIKTHDFKLKTKAGQLLQSTNCQDIIFSMAKTLLIQLIDSLPDQPAKLRLMGVRMSDLKEKIDGQPKQSTLKSFLGDNNNPSYNCPICQKIFTKLAPLNQHIDLCISEGKSKSNINIDININDDHSDLFNTNLKLLTECDSSTEQSRGTYTCGGSGTSSDKSKDNNTNRDTSESTCTNSVHTNDYEQIKDINTISEDDNTVMYCPVCQLKMPGISEDDMTRHVEDCLSHKEVKSVLETENQQKRKAGVIEGQGSKRCKVNKVSSTIDAFFHRL